MPEWKRVGYLKTSDRGPLSEHTWRYYLNLPRPLADWDTWDYWEQARTEHMASVLKPGMCLYDVGSENGWLSCVYAQMVGPENTVLIEPSALMWPNVRQTWERNFRARPLATAQVLVGREDADTEPPPGAVVLDGWPTAADGELLPHLAYNYLHEHAHETAVVSLDTLAGQVGRAPDAVTIDVEGAELLVLQGARGVLETHRPHVWVSVHPELTQRHHGYDAAEVHAYMAGLGYAGRHLGTDHEQHWHFTMERP